MNIRNVEKYLFTPVIFITALYDTKMCMFSTVQCYGFIEKPFDMEKTRNLIETAMRYHTIELREKTFIFRLEGLLGTVLVKDIIYIESRKHKLFIHPRLQRDYYKNTPDLEAFSDALEKSGHPVCYNGDIFTKTQYEAFVKRFPKVERIMLGRGVVTNPGLVREIKTGKPVSGEELRVYHDNLYESYREALGSEKDALFKMKEVWSYLGNGFVDADKYMKKIRKADRREEYSSAVNAVFDCCRMKF